MRLGPCTYEAREITHTVKHRGRIVVIDQVPAEVCSICGDVLLQPATVRHIEELLRAESAPVQTVPLYHYA
jgi:YgiT-type zinc finger domain-containing protein